jgi:hypothetical protein
MTSEKLIFTVILFAFLVCAVLAFSSSNTHAAHFEKGSKRLSVMAGSGSTFSSNYMIIGLGAGYFIADGLELGLDGEAWLGGDPDIYKLSPQVKYVLPVKSHIRPYIGTFYRRIFIDGLDDLDTIGARGGVYFIPDERWFVGIGAVYETYLNRDDDIHSSSDDIYPEITISFSF